MFRAIALLLFALGCAPIATADLIISEVYAAGSGNTTYGADWFELTNTGAGAVDISGWRMDDNSNNFTLSVALANVTSIAAGQSVVFLESSNAAFADRVKSFNQAWFGTDTSSVIIGSYTGSGVGLGTGGDAVNIFDSLGVVIARVDFGASTTGRTFDNAQGLNNTTISLLSTVDVNGAFTSFNGQEIGSPGSIAAVPEPTSIALASAALAVVISVRRRRNRS